jgi:molybdenum cofactor synthesis domain-containing protein
MRAPAEKRRMAMRAAILTTSDRCARGEARDESGRLLYAMMAARGAEVIAYEVVADDVGRIAAALRQMVEMGAQVILTTGGTGLAAADLTPEATREVIEREVPGLAEAMRAASLASTPYAMLSRAVAGVRGQTLIINLPGSPKGAKECLEVVLPALDHAVELLAGPVANESHRPPQPASP